MRNRPIAYLQVTGRRS